VNGSRLIFLVGGARSGKSDLAVRLAGSAGAPVSFVATATASDGDMAQRIRRHQADRPAGWTTIEAPLDVAGAVAAIEPASTIVVDCLTLWAANLLADAQPDEAIEAETGELARRLGARPGLSIVVSNEVGLGVHPSTGLGRHYRDLLGRVNRIVAGHAGRSLLVVAGRALELHDPLALVAQDLMRPAP
jgi:adenosyl cobinamide kinase/adenosyl cobinamide phosphate guanylyltransferase